MTNYFNITSIHTVDNKVEQIKALQKQIDSGNLPEEYYLPKLDLLYHLYDEMGEYDIADDYAFRMIEDGTSLSHKHEGSNFGASAANYVKNAYFLRAKRHFDDFLLACEWNRIPNAKFYAPRRKVLDGQHHIVKQISDFIDDKNHSLFLSISLPPGTGKSTLIKFLQAFIAGQYPLSTNMYVSYSDGMVQMMMKSVTAILTDKDEYAFNEIFPTVGTPTISAEYSTISYRKDGDFPTLGMVSLSGSVTGRTRANKFLITDDLVKNKEVARSMERLDKLNSDYKSVLTTRMIGDNVKQIMLGTIWSAHDPISVQIEEHGGDPQYKFIRIPVENEDGESNFFYEHPDRYSKERIQTIKETLDPVDYSCLMMQQPVEAMGRLFPAEEMFYYNGVLPPEPPDGIVTHIDVAWGGGDSLSMPIAYLYGETVYIHDVIFDKGDKTKTKPRVVAKILQHAIQLVNVEANNGGDEYADDIEDMIYKETKGYPASITSRKAPGNMAKNIRIEQQAPVIKKWYFLDKKHRNKEYNDFMVELQTFSTMVKVKHDDAPDSCAGLANVILHQLNRGHATKIKRFM